MNPPQPTWVSEQASDTVAGNPGPHSQILMKGVGGGGGGSNRGSYFIAQKITTSEFDYPKKSLLF